MIFKNGISLSVIAAYLAGCASLTPTREVKPSYVIYDIKAPAGVSASRISDAIRVSLQKQTSQVQLTTSIPPSPLPDEPGRFKLVNPFGANLSALAASSGNSLQVPTCDNSILLANAGKTGMAQFGEATSFFLCLIPYKAGYHLDIYTTFTMTSGGFTPEALGAQIARSVVGDSSQFIPKTINAVLDGVKETGATVTVVESYPQ